MGVTAASSRIVAIACGGVLLAAAVLDLGATGTASAATATAAQVQQPPPTQPPPAQGRRGGGRGEQTPIDDERARRLYVSNRWEDHPRANFQAQIDAKAKEDARYPELCKGLLECTKIKYPSSVGDMDIPAYLFQPLARRGPRGHAAMIWVHGGVHGNWTLSPYFPFVKEAVQRGYVVIAPEYRGSTGYGEAHHLAIDYGGKEVDDVMSAYEYLKTLPHVDTDRVGMMGWSHGGYITLLSLFRDSHPFKAGAAIVPVTNLIFRLSFKGPSYQRSFSTQKEILGLPFEQRAEYVRRSPVFHVDKLNVPVLVHVATNDTDVNFEEAQQIIDALRARKPYLSETKIYVNPAPGRTSEGHTFSRRVNPDTLQREDSPEQIDSWNRVWTFFNWNLRPDEDRGKQ